MKFYQDKKYLKIEFYYRVVLAVFVAGLWISTNYQFFKNDTILSSMGAFLIIFVNGAFAIYVYLLHRAYLSHRESILHSCIEIEDGFIKMYEREQLVAEQPMSNLQKLVVYSKKDSVNSMLLYFNKHVPFVLHRLIQPNTALEYMLRLVGPNCKVVKKQKIF